MKMKKALLLVLSALLVVFLAACGSSGNQSGGAQQQKQGQGSTTQKSQDKPITLKIGSWFASTHHFQYNAFEPWKKIVEEKTNGRVIVEIYPGSALGKSTSVLEDVSGGAYDVGYLSPSYWSDTSLFIQTIGNLPFSFDSVQTAVSVMTKFMERYGKDVYAENGLILMGLTSTDPYIISSKEKIEKVTDLKNKRIRVPDVIWKDVVEGWGAIPVSMPVEEEYLALERGTIDALIDSGIGGHARKVYEVGPYITKFPEGSGFFNMQQAAVMSPAFFNSLPDDLKTLFQEELNPLLAQFINESYIKEVQAIYQKYEEAVKGKGALIEVTPENAKEFMLPAQKTWEAWKQEAIKRGYPGEEMMEYYKQLLKEHGIELPF